MKIPDKKCFLLTAFLIAGMLNLYAQNKNRDETQDKTPAQTQAPTQAQPPQERLKPVVITIGKKNEMFVGKNALIEARKLSAFYFEMNNRDPKDFAVTRYSVSIFPKGQSGAVLQMDCYTDVFHARIIETLQASPAGSKISFTNIKATLTNPEDRSIGLMPDMKLTLTED